MKVKYIYYSSTTKGSTSFMHVLNILVYQGHQLSLINLILSCSKWEKFGI